jgi:hypothetical protein
MTVPFDYRAAMGATDRIGEDRGNLGAAFVRIAHDAYGKSRKTPTSGGGAA